MGICVGDVVGGRYEVLASVGVGGMSRVWLARDARLQKLWAVKEMRRDVPAPQREAARRAILEEAGLMKGLDHPAIPRVVEVEELPDGTPYVVMDYVEGCSLASLLGESPGGLDQADVVSWALQLCDVLGYLHHREPPVVYRDLKPANVMVRDDGAVRLVDFGIAEELAPDGSGDGRLVGSRGYSAPEQMDPSGVRPATLDGRADVYALGTTLYSLLTGEVPGRLPGGAASGPWWVRADDPRVPEGLGRVVARATREDRELRYRDVDEMRYDLEHHERLTRAYRDALRSRVLRFRATALLGCSLLAASASCLAGSAVARARSYEGLMREAAAAQDASAREEALRGAIATSPGDARAYEALLAAYKEDGAFDGEEARRWASTWAEWGGALEGSDRLARVCYDAGILFLCYYGQPEGGGEDGGSGRLAIERAGRAAEWFGLAREACDAERGDFRGLVVADGCDEYARAGDLETIAEFHLALVEARREGRDASPLFASLWGTLSSALGPSGAGDGEGREPIVTLRLCQMAHEALASPTYLEGMRRAGVGREEVESMALRVEEEARSLSGFAAANRESAWAMYEEVALGAEGLRRNVDAIYANPAVRLEG